MRQNINLYQSILIDRPLALRAGQSGLMLSVFLVLLSGLGLSDYWRLRSGQQALEQLRTAESRQAELVAELERQYPVRQKDPALADEVRLMEQKLEGQKQVLIYFGSKVLSENDRMLATLEGLARHTRQGIWLNRILLTDAGDQVRLAGSALRPEQVPSYVQYLGEKGVFGGTTFSRLKLTRLKERPEQIDFELETQGVQAQ